jgi:hypothetical protein
MAEFTIRNGLNPHKAIRCTITFRQIINKGEEGEPVWVLQLGTTEPHKDGGEIAPVFVHYTSATNLDEAVSEAVATISDQVDWLPLTEDVRPPFVVKYIPSGGESKLIENVCIDIKDLRPAAGIDIDSIKLTVNGQDVTDDTEIVGDPYYYTVTWRPPFRRRRYYEE